VDELADSSGLVRDPDALRGRLAADGYLFFRGLLDAAQVRETGQVIMARLRSGGWVTGDGTPAARPPAVNTMDAFADPAYRAAATSPAFNRLPYLMPLRSLVRSVLGPRAFSYPAKVLRAVYPEGRDTRTKGRYIHYDYGVSGVQDMLTSWLPLMDIPVRLGGLAVRPGGHRGRPWPPRVLSAFQPGWATTSYRPGDVIIFHCLTPHAAMANHAAALRLSGDFRWQTPDRPAPAEMVLGPKGRRELFSLLFSRQPWWEPVPAGLALYPRNDMIVAPPGPSRFFQVHPGWQRWRPPPGAVH
jgi:hypothetical protein